VEDGVLTIAMECAYAPYNWSQSDDSNGAVPISNVPGTYANGYDVMIARQICEANGWELEVVQSDWDSLVPGVQTGTFDAVIAGQSMTAERSEQVDFAGPYYYASIVCVTKTDSPYANAAGISDLSGGTCTAQIATIWYDSCLPQIEGAQVQTAAETAPAMLMALETDAVDFICTDMPTAMGAVAAYPDMKILDFTDSDDNFEVDEGEINIGISVMKGNTELKEAIDSVLSTMTADDFNTLMNEAIAIQPLSEKTLPRMPRGGRTVCPPACFPHINSLPKGVCLHGETVPAGIRHCQALVELRRVPLSARHPQYLDSGTGGHRHRLPDRIRLRHSEHHSPQQERPARQAVLSGADPGSGPDLRGDLPGYPHGAAGGVPLLRPALFYGQRRAV